MPIYQLGSFTTQHLMGMAGFLDASVINGWKWLGCFWKCTWLNLTLLYYALMGIFNAAVFFHSPSKLVIALSQLPAWMAIYQLGSFTTQHLMGLAGFLDDSVINVWNKIGYSWKCTWLDLTLIYWALMEIFNTTVFVFIQQVTWWLLSLNCQIVCQAINSFQSPPNASSVWQGLLMLLLLMFENK